MLQKQYYFNLRSLLLYILHSALNFIQTNKCSIRSNTLLTYILKFQSLSIKFSLYTASITSPEYISRHFTLRFNIAVRARASKEASSPRLPRPNATFTRAHYPTASERTGLTRVRECVSRLRFSSLRARCISSLRHAKKDSAIRRAQCRTNDGEPNIESRACTLFRVAIHAESHGEKGKEEEKK